MERPHVGEHQDLPTGGHSDGTAVITESERIPCSSAAGFAPPIRGGRFQPAQLSGAAQISQIWRARVRRRSGSSSRRFGRQTPGQGPWPGETHVRQLQLPPDNASEHHGRLPPVTTGTLAAVGGLIPVSALSLHLQLKTSNKIPEIVIGS